MLLHDILPPDDPRDARHCLVLHGLGDNKNGWKPVVGELGLPRLGWIFAQAPMPYHDGWSWFDIGNDFAIDDDQIRESRSALTTLIDHLLERLGIPSERLFLMGFSQGCQMVIDQALRADRRFAGVIGISGFLRMVEEFPAAFGAAGLTQDILMTHGLYDGLLPIINTRRIKDRLLKLGARIDWREYPKQHSVDPLSELPDIAEWLTKRIGA